MKLDEMDRKYQTYANSINQKLDKIYDVATEEYVEGPHVEKRVAFEAEVCDENDTSEVLPIDIPVQEIKDPEFTILDSWENTKVVPAAEEDTLSAGENGIAIYPAPQRNFFKKIIYLHENYKIYVILCKVPQSLRQSKKLLQKFNSKTLKLKNQKPRLPINPKKI